MGQRLLLLAERVEPMEVQQMGQRLLLVLAELVEQMEVQEMIWTPTLDPDCAGKIAFQ
jgi:hypothetical protein